MPTHYFQLNGLTFQQINPIIKPRDGEMLPRMRTPWLVLVLCFVCFINRHILYTVKNITERGIIAQADHPLSNSTVAAVLFLFYEMFRLVYIYYAIQYL